MVERLAYSQNQVGKRHLAEAGLLIEEKDETGEMPTANSCEAPSKVAVESCSWREKLGSQIESTEKGVQTDLGGEFESRRGRVA
jgi:hypothetical protein